MRCKFPKERKKEGLDLIVWLTVVVLATTLTLINCEIKTEKKDDTSPLIAAALASRGSGTVATATGTGTAATYTIGGTITGLTASGLVLQNNVADDLTVASGATSFTFATRVTGAYAVTVKTQPTGLNCIVSSGTGTASAAVTSVSLACVADGSSWTARTLPNANWTSVAYGNGVFAAIAFQKVCAVFNEALVSV
jgi:hypothetical protein